MTHLELRARIGPDGILTLTVPVGISEANREVRGGLGVTPEVIPTVKKRKDIRPYSDWFKEEVTINAGCG